VRRHDGVACVVAERLGFSREEALSIVWACRPTLPFLIHEPCYAMPSVVYTEMTRLARASRSVSTTRNAKRISKSRIPVKHSRTSTSSKACTLYRSASGAWRAFTAEDDGRSSTPGAAYSYITRALRQTHRGIGAMRLLAESHSDRWS